MLRLAIILSFMGIFIPFHFCKFSSTHLHLTLVFLCILVKFLAYVL